MLLECQVEETVHGFHVITVDAFDVIVIGVGGDGTPVLMMKNGINFKVTNHSYEDLCVWMAMERGYVDDEKEPWENDWE